MLKILNEPWKALSAAAELNKSRQLDVLTGYLGRGAAHVVSKLRATDVRIVIGLPENNQELSLAQRDEVAELQRQGVLVHFANGLHAKVYLFKSAVVLGSANFTRSGFEVLDELVVLSDEKALVHQARSEFERVWRRSAPIDLTKVKVLKSSSSDSPDGSGGLGAAKAGGGTPFSDKAGKRAKGGKDATGGMAKKGVGARKLRLAAFFPTWVSEIDRYDEVNWSTGEATKPGDLQLFCITKTGEGESEFSPGHAQLDSVHSLWRATSDVAIDPTNRWPVHADFELVARLKNPVPKHELVSAGLLKAPRWPQGYKGKIFRGREFARLVALIEKFNPGFEQRAR